MFSSAVWAMWAVQYVVFILSSHLSINQALSQITQRTHDLSCHLKNPDICYRCMHCTCHSTTSSFVGHHHCTSEKLPLIECVLDWRFFPSRCLSETTIKNENMTCWFCEHFSEELYFCESPIKLCVCRDGLTVGCVSFSFGLLAFRFLYCPSTMKNLALHMVIVALPHWVCHITH